MSRHWIWFKIPTKWSNSQIACSFYPRASFKYTLTHKCFIYILLALFVQPYHIYFASNLFQLKKIGFICVWLSFSLAPSISPFSVIEMKFKTKIVSVDCWKWYSLVMDSRRNPSSTMVQYQNRFHKNFHSKRLNVHRSKCRFIHLLADHILTNMGCKCDEFNIGTVNGSSTCMRSNHQSQHQ